MLKPAPDAHRGSKAQHQVLLVAPAARAAWPVNRQLPRGSSTHWSELQSTVQRIEQHCNEDGQKCSGFWGNHVLGKPATSHCWWCLKNSFGRQQVNVDNKCLCDSSIPTWHFAWFIHIINFQCVECKKQNCFWKGMGIAWRCTWKCTKSGAFRVRVPESPLSATS